jgi:hypothetical protein
MKAKSTVVSLVMALTIAILFVSGQNVNNKSVNKPSAKMQPPTERQLEIENNLISSAVPGVR